MAIITTGIDLAKNVFAVHGVTVTATGTVKLRHPMATRGKLNAPAASRPPCLVAMEACSGPHYWAR